MCISAPIYISTLFFPLLVFTLVFAKISSFTLALARVIPPFPFKIASCLADFISFLTITIPHCHYGPYFSRRAQLVDQCGCCSQCSLISGEFSYSGCLEDNHSILVCHHWDTLSLSVIIEMSFLAFCASSFVWIFPVRCTLFQPLQRSWHFAFSYTKVSVFYADSLTRWVNFD